MAYIPRDKFAQRAKKQEYRARSAYKLLDLQQKFRIMKPGDFVLDLGAAPGSWLQVASQIAGAKGKVVGIDLLTIEKLPGAHIETIQKNVLDQDIAEYALKRAAGNFDVVLSDMAPQTSGIQERDQLLAEELSWRALEISRRVLRKNGNAVVKIFEGPDTQELVRETKRRFASVKLVKPSGSQKGSKEFYIIARNFKGLRAGH